MSAPRLYETKITKEKTFQPLFRSGEEYSFCINFDEPIIDPDFSRFKLQLWKGQTVVKTDIGSLQKDVVAGIAYNIMCNFLFPSVPNGCYNFAIVDTTSGALKCKSNSILVENTEWQNSSIIEWKNTFNFNNTNYEDNPGFINRMRLVLSEVEMQMEVDRKQYRSISSGRLRNVKSYLDPWVKIEAIGLDNDAHRAMAALCEHDMIRINGTQYIAKSAYQIEGNPESPISKGTVELYEA